MENNYKNLKEKAYKVALKFKGSKLEQEIVYAKLEKQGFPENIAKEVALNMVIEKKNLNKEDFLDYKKIECREYWNLVIEKIGVRTVCSMGTH